jgi:hypothetical protein
VAAILLGRRIFAQHALPQILLVGALAAAGSALIQLKGWPYHLLPALGLGCMAGGAACTIIWRNGQWSPRATAALLVLFIAGWSKPAAALLDGSAFGAPHVDELTEVLREEAGPGGSIYGFMTSGRGFAASLLASEVDWAAPVGGPYLLPAAVRPDGPPHLRAELQKAADRQLALILDSLERRKPGLIVFDNKRWKLGFGAYPFDYVDYLQRYPGYRALLANYEEREPIGEVRLFVRKAAEPKLEQ